MKMHWEDGSIWTTYGHGGVWFYEHAYFYRLDKSRQREVIARKNPLIFTYSEISEIRVFSSRPVRRIQ